jgi:hypothetical protein
MESKHTLLPGHCLLEPATVTLKLNLTFSQDIPLKAASSIENALWRESSLYHCKRVSSLDALLGSDAPPKLQG